MMTGARLTPEGLHVLFADDHSAVIPRAVLDLGGAPVRVGLPTPYAIEVHLDDERVEEVPWDFARHFADPDHRRRSIAIVERSGRVLGERLRELRSAAGLTQEALAQRAGVSRVTIARIEVGDHLPRYQTMEALAAGLGAPISRLIVG